MKNLYEVYPIKAELAKPENDEIMERNEGKVIESRSNLQDKSENEKLQLLKDPLEARLPKSNKINFSH